MNHRPGDPIRYRCLERSCWHQFDFAPRQVRDGSQVGQGIAGGACPVCGSHARRLSWYGLMTQAKAEASVRDRLKAAGHRALYLHYLVSVKRADRFSKSRRRKGTIEEAKVRRPVLPSGYIFARLTTDDIAPACGLPGVVGFVGTSQGAGPIPDAEMEEFLGWGDKDGCVPLERPTEAGRRLFEVGDMVRILRGGFEGFERPIVADDGKDMVKVMMTIFGHENEVALPYWHVELARRAAPDVAALAARTPRA